jgi:hypothetical protein
MDEEDKEAGSGCFRGESTEKIKKEKEPSTLTNSN